MVDSYNLAVLIPVYNHEESIGQTLSEVLSYEYPVLLVDDGSRETCQQVLLDLAESFPDRVTLIRLESNMGKGGAIKAGFKQLKADGYSHAVQIDSDGQHSLSDLPLFVATSVENPLALVTGYPVYDESVPKLRYYCRYLTHVWIWINTLSFKIRDSMCGFRVYPLNRVTKLLEDEPCGNRMDFDPELIVRWSWCGYAIVNLPTRVNYPADGVSHFKLWLDNWLISVMHTRLFFGMLIRFPKIIFRRING